MKCKCGGTGWVYLNRKKESGAVYRRRRCSECGAKWTTIEIRKDDYDEILNGIVGIAREMKSQK